MYIVKLFAFSIDFVRSFAHEFLVHIYDMSYFFFFLLSVYDFYGSNGIKTGPYSKTGHNDKKETIQF
jgi:hypothetical protein